MLVLDSGGVSRLAERSRRTAALIVALRGEDLRPPLVPSVVLVECLQGHLGRDALTNSFLKTCDIVEEIPQPLARRAAPRCSDDRRAEVPRWTRSSSLSQSQGGRCSRRTREISKRSRSTHTTSAWKRCDSEARATPGVRLDDS